MYNHGLYFSEILAVNLKDALQRVKIGKASCLVIDGGVGEGKTTLAVHIADYINSLHNLPPIDLTEQNSFQIAMGGKDFANKMQECFNKGFPVIIYDEAGDYARRQAMTQFNAFLNRIFETYRAFKIIVIICLPNQYVLDNALFDNNIPRLLLHLYGRTQRQGNFSGYSLYRAFFVRGFMRKSENKSIGYKANEPNFYGHFLDLSTERIQQLDSLTIKNKLAILQKTQINMNENISLQEMSEKTQLTHKQIQFRLRKIGIKPSQLVGQSRYYHISALERLEELLKE